MATTGTTGSPPGGATGWYPVPTTTANNRCSGGGTNHHTTPVVPPVGAVAIERDQSEAMHQNQGILPPATTRQASIEQIQKK